MDDQSMDDITIGELLELMNKYSEKDIREFEERLLKDLEERKQQHKRKRGKHGRLTRIYN